MGYTSDDLRDINVLIYPISDDLGHHHNDTLAALNEKVRSQLVSEQGCAGSLTTCDVEFRRPTSCSSLPIMAFRSFSPRTA